MPEVIVMPWRPIGAAFSPSETSDQGPSSALQRQSARAPRWLLHCILIWLPRRLPITPLSPPLEAPERLVEGTPSNGHRNWSSRSSTSALGQERTSRHVRVMSALPPKADMVQHTNGEFSVNLSRQ